MTLRIVFALVACLALAVVGRAEARFSKALSPAQWVAAGYIHLNTPQANALDELIQKDIDSARAGDVHGFAKTFTQRRTPEERQRAGIETLTTSEREVLDELVAAAIAGQSTANAVSAATLAAARPVAEDAVHLEKPRAQVHGEVSLFMGKGSGGASWYGGSVDAWVTDPSGHFTLGVGYSEVHGKGWGCPGGLIW